MEHASSVAICYGCHCFNIFVFKDSRFQGVKWQHSTPNNLWRIKWSLMEFVRILSYLIMEFCLFTYVYHECEHHHSQTVYWQYLALCCNFKKLPTGVHTVFIDLEQWPFCMVNSSHSLLWQIEQVALLNLFLGLWITGMEARFVACWISPPPQHPQMTYWGWSSRCFYVLLSL